MSYEKFKAAPFVRESSEKKKVKKKKAKKKICPMSVSAGMGLERQMLS